MKNTVAQSPIKILPVLDLQRGQVVQGIAGQRARYQPIQSKLCQSSNPVSVWQALANVVGHSEVYVADLDGLEHGTPDFSALKSLGNAGAKMWLDVGIRNQHDASQLVQFCNDSLVDWGIIGALETLESEDLVASCVELTTSDRFIFSLDLKNGEPRVPNKNWPIDAMEIVDRVVRLGVRRIIVLDVAAVGGDRVTTLKTCKAIQEKYPHLELTTGGGVNSLHDLQQIATAGCQTALVSTWLHAHKKRG